MSDSSATRSPIQLEHVSKVFASSPAVDDVSLSLGNPGITALIGPNGAGKTTLFNLITGQLRASSGRITVDGEDVTAKSPSEMARLGMGRSFQEVRLFASMSVRDNVAVYAQQSWSASILGTIALAPRAFRERRRANAEADRVLTYLGLERFADVRAGDLSFAQQKLIAIARLLALNPRFIFLDEPASGLDEEGRGTLADTMRLLVDDGYPICFVEHNTHLVRELSTRVVFLSQGRVLADGTPDDVFSNPQLAESYLGFD
ncbi:ABC transporter ATP-binding protein [Microbacterium sp. RD1]|uniref:ABC transporter ATP-binding protein n=1 Tax=Microbacterium sp. RD1 TaxID=3457313 RepID=UPI003FA5963F